MTEKIIHSGYQLDVLGEPYQRLEFSHPDDYEGAVISSIVRKKAEQPTKKAALYVHGFCDYFFQTEMAEQFNAHGFDFYALDLRKYGRSHLSHQKLYNVRDLSEYNADLDAAIGLIEDEGHDAIVLCGHSTGGLITTLYAAQHPQHKSLRALWLNSPFYDFNMRDFEKKTVLPRLSQLAQYLPDLPFPSRLNKFYVPSLHQFYHGEWLFNLEWKKPKMPFVRLSFIRAIHQAQQTLHQGIHLNVPTLVMHSHQTRYPLRFNRTAQTCDVILNIHDMQKWGKSITGDVQFYTAQNALHDVVLSKRPVRQAAYKKLFEWLNHKGL